MFNNYISQKTKIKCNKITKIKTGIKERYSKQFNVNTDSIFGKLNQ